MRSLAVLLLSLLGMSLPAQSAPDDLEKRVIHGYATSTAGVRIHYAALGDPQKPLVIMIHGFPDFWYTWRHQMTALSGDYYTVAIDQRGYNLSDKPSGVEQYDMKLLVDDVAAVIRAVGRERGIVVGHDWGGAVAWAVAMMRPEVVEKLIILNLPHMRGLRRELATNQEQARNSQYARNFQQPDAAKALTPEGLASWVTDPAARAKYVEAFRRSDAEAMLAYYKQNYPREPYTPDTSPLVKVKAPVLVIHGLGDRFLLSGALNDTWQWVEKDLTITTIPGVGHFVQHEATEMVNRTIRMWLAR
jgi:pimeloyl-ACP methyl ester carboxylesterase